MLPELTHDVLKRAVESYTDDAIRLMDEPYLSGTGKEVVGVRFVAEVQLVSLALAIAAVLLEDDDEADIGTVAERGLFEPRVETLGRSLVAFWPGVRFDHFVEA